MYGLDLGSIPNRSTRVLISPWCNSFSDIIIFFEHEITICPDFAALRGQQVIYDILLTGIINESLEQHNTF